MAVGLFIAENSSALGKVPKAIKFLKDTKRLMKVLGAAKTLKAAVRILTAEVGALGGVTDLVSRCT